MLSTPSGGSTRGSHRLIASNQDCDLRFSLAYFHGVKPKSEPPWRVLGSLIHNCLAYHYASRLEDKPTWIARSLDEVLVETAMTKLDRSLLDKGGLFAIEAARGTAAEQLISTAKEVMLAYKKYNLSEAWAPRFVEEEFSASVGEIDPEGADELVVHERSKPDGTIGFRTSNLNDERITCKSDLVIEANGEYWVVDYKCSGGEYEPGRGYQDRLPQWRDDGEYRISWQAMINLHLLRLRLDKPVRGFIVQRIKRRAPYDFDRHNLRVGKLAYEGARRSVRAFVKGDIEAVNALERGEKPIANYAACYGRYGPCDYIDICDADSRETQDAILDKSFVKIGGLSR